MYIYIFTSNKEDISPVKRDNENFTSPKQFFIKSDYVTQKLSYGLLTSLKHFKHL